MKKFTVEIACDSAAFVDNPAWEIMTILHKLRRLISERPRTTATTVPGAGLMISGVFDGEVIPLFDSNNRQVGEAKFTVIEEESDR